MVNKKMVLVTYMSTLVTIASLAIVRAEVLQHVAEDLYRAAVHKGAGETGGSKHWNRMEYGETARWPGPQAKKAEPS